MTLNRMVMTGLGVCALGVLASCAAPGGGSQDASAMLDRANRAMGAAMVKSIRFAGTGTGATYGRVHQPNL